MLKAKLESKAIFKFLIPTKKCEQDRWKESLDSTGEFWILSFLFFSRSQQRKRIRFGSDYLEKENK